MGVGSAPGQSVDGQKMSEFLQWPGQSTHRGLFCMLSNVPLHIDICENPVQSYQGLASNTILHKEFFAILTDVEFFRNEKLNEGGMH